jgi:uncharacterized protein YbjT (DUF2867 family)
MKRILITGGTGQVGSEVVAQLHAAGLPVRALSRRPEATRFPADVEIASGDLTRPETLNAALDGIGAVFLVWVAPLEPAARAIERIASRATRIVFLSSPIHTNHPFFQQQNPLRHVHAGVEALIEKSAAEWTVLRPGPFALNCRNWWAPQLRTGDVVRWFHGDAQTAAVHERDLAAVAARVLCEYGHHGRDYVLTGPQSLTQRDHVEQIGDAIGRKLAFVELSPVDSRRDLLAGWPSWAADMLLSAYGAAVNRPAVVTTTIEEITGKPARSFREWSIDHAADFRWV